MTLMIWLLLALLVILAAAFASVKVPYARLSRFEMKRLAEQGDAHAMAELQFVKYRTELLTLVRMVVIMLLVTVGLIAVSAFGAGWGIVITLLAILLFGQLAWFSLISTLAQRLFDRHREAIVAAIARSRVAAMILKTPASRPGETTVHSKEELVHLIEHSERVIPPMQRTMLLNTLTFDDTTIEELMTPAQQVATIDKRELLGPLTLDDLHKTHHDRFPVVDGSFDLVIGVLYLSEHLTVDSTRRSVTAEKAMRPGVVTIHYDQPLRSALASLIKRHQDIAIVVNNKNKPIGLLSLDDIIKAVLGAQTNPGDH